MAGGTRTCENSTRKSECPAWALPDGHSVRGRGRFTPSRSIHLLMRLARAILIDSQRRINDSISPPSIDPEEDRCASGDAHMSRKNRKYVGSRAIACARAIISAVAVYPPNFHPGPRTGNGSLISSDIFCATFRAIFVKVLHDRFLLSVVEFGHWSIPPDIVGPLRFLLVILLMANPT